MGNTNLFSFFSSTDFHHAFLSWLLSCANLSVKKIDKSLNAFSVNFIKELYKRNQLNLVEIYSVDIEKKSVQFFPSVLDVEEDIKAVCCVINKEDILVIITGIDGRVEYSEENKAIDKYIEKLRGYDFQKFLLGTVKNIVTVVLNLFDKRSYFGFYKYEIPIISRKEFLEITRSYHGENQIFIDYRNNLYEFDLEFQKFWQLKVQDWSSQAWAGFFKEIQERIDGGYWSMFHPIFHTTKYNFWFDLVNEKESCIEMRLSNDRIKFYINLEEDAELRCVDDFIEYLEERCKELNFGIVKDTETYLKYKEYRDLFLFHAEVTVLYLKESYISYKGGILDIEKTIQVIQKFRTIMNSFIK